jgi:Mn2+/Fe2+ NRAMP family transporter
VAALTGIAIFLIAACFQFGNNLGVLAAIEPLYDPAPAQTSSDNGVDAAAEQAGEEQEGNTQPAAANPRPNEEDSDRSAAFPVLLIVNLNLLIIAALFGFRGLYGPVERSMKFLVGLMILGFAVNLFLAKPNLQQMITGLVPKIPDKVEVTLVPAWKEAVVENGAVIERGRVVDPFGPLTALFATTFSVAGAFYQSYLVRQKGWTRNNLGQGLIDSAVGISVLGLITLMIMVTAASVLHGNQNVGELKSLADVARQLEPTFGRFATVLFCMGIFAGALSSFLVNAMIGGSLLADGFGLGGYIDQRWPKLFTVLALAVGLNVAVWVHLGGGSPVRLIIFAQAMTVLGVPLLAGGMLWLATRSDLSGERAIPVWMKLVACIGLAISLFLALRTAFKLLLPLINS